MTTTNLFYKDGDNVYKTSITYELSEWIETNPNTEYHVITGSSFDMFTDCLVFDNGTLKYDLLLLKEAVQNVRKNIRQAKFKPYDDVILQINGLAIPEDRLNATHAQLLADAEAQRVLIWQASEAKKQEIIDATTAEEVLEIWQDIVA
jgi:hypothetical protein